MMDIIDDGLPLLVYTLSFINWFWIHYKIWIHPLLFYTDISPKHSFISYILLLDFRYWISFSGLDRYCAAILLLGFYDLLQFSCFVTSFNWYVFKVMHLILQLINACLWACVFVMLLSIDSSIRVLSLS